MKPKSRNRAHPLPRHTDRSARGGDSGTGNEGVKARFLDRRHVGRRGRVWTTGKVLGTGWAVCPEDEVGNCSGREREKPGQYRAGARRLGRLS